jgi:hypothetical protein
VGWRRPRRGEQDEEEWGGEEDEDREDEEGRERERDLGDPPRANASGAVRRDRGKGEERRYVDSLEEDERVPV